MTQSNFSSQKAFESTEHQKKFHLYKVTLEQIQTELEPGPRLREMKAQAFVPFMEDLTKIGQEVNSVKFETENTKNIKLADQIAYVADSVYSNIRKAIIELSLAMDLLDWRDKLEARDIEIALNARRDVYACLSNCQEYIRDAIRELP